MIIKINKFWITKIYEEKRYTGILSFLRLFANKNRPPLMRHYDAVCSIIRTADITRFDTVEVNSMKMIVMDIDYDITNPYKQVKLRTIKRVTNKCKMGLDEDIKFIQIKNRVTHPKVDKRCNTQNLLT